MALQRSSTSDGSGWPTGRVPVEIFWQVASYLPDRKDIESMRLVSREFNMKVVCFFMRQLIVSFGPEKSMKLAHDAGLSSTSSAFDMTKRVLDSELFQYFAPHIQRLGLAFELSESELASPMIDDLEEVDLRDGAVYRRFVLPDQYRLRPHAPLDKVTTALENCQGVFRLLSTATEVQELALSCDGGLGYLQGPDVNRFQPPGRLPVFSTHNAARMTEDTSLQVTFDKPYKLEVLERKLAALGVEPADIPGKIAVLLEHEGITMKELTHEHRARAPLPLSRHQAKFVRPRSFDDKIRLQPDQLTRSQMWYLHQHLSAQNALIQSFVTTMLDNSTAFTRLTKLNLARIPSFHLDTLCRDDFWSSLPQVEDVALGVIPDWRSVKQASPYDMSVRQVYPTDAIPKVFNLLKNYIGQQPNIERLHFEWHCGGELAAGILHRDSHVLPAPFIEQHRMVIDSRRENLLVLPYITHLSLKNCWFAPNVFYHVMNTMAVEHGLESLELETVSLSGPPILRDNMLDIDPAPRQIKVTSAHPANLGGSEYILQLGQRLSWSHIIDALSPVKTIIETVSELDHGYQHLRIKKGYKIQRLVFKSCGYVHVPDERFISNRRFQHTRIFTNESGRDLNQVLEWYRQKSYDLERFVQISSDRHLARIVRSCDPAEESTMKTVWGFRAGWDGIYDEATINAADQDGTFFPGLGRFSGTIERVPDVVAEDDDELYDYEIDTSKFEQGYDDAVRLDFMLMAFELSHQYHQVGRS